MFDFLLKPLAKSHAKGAQAKGNTKAKTKQPAKNKRQIGQHAEQLALAYLQEQGLKVITQNFYSRFGEIDLIMREPSKGQTPSLVFVEVRQRKNLGYGSALESIDIRKQNKLRKTAEYFLIQHHDYQNLQPRFDVVIIPPSQCKEPVNWLKNAF